MFENHFKSVVATELCYHANMYINAIFLVRRSAEILQKLINVKFYFAKWIIFDIYGEKSFVKSCQIIAKIICDFSSELPPYKLASIWWKSCFRACLRVITVFGKSAANLVLTALYVNLFGFSNIFRSIFYCFPSPYEQHDTTAVVQHNSCCSFGIPLPRRRLNEFHFKPQCASNFRFISRCRFKQFCFHRRRFFPPLATRTDRTMCNWLKFTNELLLKWRKI